METEEELVLVFMPSLLAVLVDAERKSDEPLSEEAVIEIRDGAHCVASPPDVAQRVTEARGYDDVDPEDVWNEWQRLRAELCEEKFSA